MAADETQRAYDISLIVHGDLPEDVAIYSERQRLFPRGCLVCVDTDGEIVGYTLSHPIVPDCPPPLNTLLGTIDPALATHYYIHDVAILPSMRGKGMANIAIAMLLDVARAYEKTILISVYGTGPFWSKFGFVQDKRDLTKKLEPYGETAIMMYHVGEDDGEGVEN